ncbi:Glucosaminyl phosphatidylinositol (GlcN-PI) nositol acylation protein [Mycoemilia scoparia]|uniref:GPI-anchored wall transfer protein n=1 Tax=Mycoemilia scoparia TaxID=417184 RepID=A0A9W8DU47_9FUNG|nr:Glucosaminyl phosphatidylinositol (GlcN-PI) nositol acylation protein [Mycoemilia scoparia]
MAFFSEYLTWGMSPQEQTAYKQEKEAFVSDLEGGSMTKAHALTFMMVFSYWAWKANTAKKFHQNNDQFPTSPTTFSFIREGITFAAPFIVAMCYPSTFNITLISLGLFLKGLNDFRTGIPAPPQRRDKWEKDPRAIAYDSRFEPNKVTPKGFLNVCRSMLMLMTCFSILAVDFNIFSREFAKSETFGNTLMDLGVGSFVFSAGIVGYKPYIPNSGKGGSQPTRDSIPVLIFKGLKASLPLIALGLIRFIMVEGVDYQKHVSEYGVHWNFFLTLGLLPIFIPICMRISPQPRFAGYAIIILYQVLLWCFGLEDWIFTADRGSGFIAANKEGICSFLGYLSIALVGMGIGQTILPDPATWKDRADIPISMFAEWVLTWLAFGQARFLLGIDVSRRLANLPYVLWIVWFNTFVIWSMLIIENFIDGRLPPRFIRSKLPDNYTSPSLLSAVNKNSLSTFLFANLCTGAVNLTFKTLRIPDTGALAILTLYMIAILVPCVLLYIYNIRIR